MSDRKLTDTIIFYKAQSSYTKTRDFECGFYDTKGVSVRYQLTLNSYHKFIEVEGTDPEPEFLISISKSSSNEKAGGEISFLGLIFSEQANAIVDTDRSALIYQENRSEYSGVNIQNGITGFEYSFKEGIISYWDKKGNKWKRQ